MKNLNELNEMNIEKLVEIWDLISLQKVTCEVATVRGWILEALERKNPEGMDQYYDGFYEDEDLKKFVL